MNLRRKRLKLMRDTQWRGYLRTATGNPITLSQVRSMVNLSALGNSAQNGIPSPDNPVEVVGSGVRTGNLFDVSKIEDTALISIHGNDITITNYTASTNFTPELLLEMTGLSQGDTITTSRKVKIIDGTGNNITGRISFMRKDKASTFVIIDGTDSFRTTVIPDDFDSDNYNTAVFYGVNAGDTRTVIFSEVQILKGEYTSETLPPYEPYGYKVAAQASGCNLFTALGRKISELKGSSPTSSKEFGDNVIVEGISSNGYVASANKPEYSISDNIISIYPTNGSGYGLGFDIDVVAGEYYSISYTVLVGKADVCLSYYDSDGIYISREMSSSSTGTVFACKIPDSANKVILNLSETYGQTLRHIEVTDIMLVKGKYSTLTMPQYEQYKEPQSFNIYTPQILNGVGDSHDTVLLDFDNRRATLINNIAQDVFNGGWGGYTQTNNIARAYHTTKPTMRVSPVNIADVVSDIFISTTSTHLSDAAYQIAGNTNTSVINATLDANVLPSTDIDGFNTFMAKNPVTVYYVLAESNTTDITSLQQWDTLPDLKGTWILTANGGTEPTLTAEYYSNERSRE